jgi:hypothetical protein
MRRKKILTVAAIVAGSLGLYALAGFYWVPRLVRSQVTELFADDYGREIGLGEVRFNPFTFEFEARDFTVPDTDGKRMLGFDRLFLDFELASLWHRAWTFRDIYVERPYARVVQRADGSLNLADLAPPNSDPAPDDQQPPDIPAVRIGNLDVAEGRIDVADLTRAQPFATTLAPVSFELTDFRTAGSGNTFAFTAGSDRAGQLSVDGSFGVAPLSSHGSLTLAGLQATAISEYLGELIPVSLESGIIDLGFTYDFSLAGEPFTLILDMPSLTVRELSTVAQGYDVPWQIPAIDLRDTRVDLAARTVVMNSIEVTDVVAPVWLDASGFNAPGVLPRADEQDAVPAASTGAEDGASSWSVSIPSVSVLNARLPFENRTLKRPATLELVAKSVKVQGFAVPARESLQVEAVVASGAGGEVSTSGSIRLEPLEAGMDLQVRALNLTPLQPYLDDHTDLLFESGALTSKGRLEVTGIDPLKASYTGDIAIADLHTRDRPLKEDFVNWKSLEVNGIRYASTPAALDIKEIVAREPYMRLILAESGVTNIESILDPAAAADKAAAIEAERAAAKSGKDSKADTSKPAGDEVVAPVAGPTGPSVAITIGNTRIVDGSVNFADFTTEPDFQIAMEQLKGFIKGSSSDPGSRSELELDGQVDRYAPVHIAGKLNLLAPATYIDIAASFRNIDLTSFNPYSTKFIGYQIAKGKLFIDTEYRVEDNRLEAIHQVKLDQLEFGDKIDSPDAIGLPIKLAVALLKDSQGVIDLELPVSGSVDDPQFKLGPIIWKAFVGLMTKIVTAPFALLGNLFGGGEDLAYLDFAAGSAEVDAAATDKIVVLRKALTERPTLRLEIPWTAAAAVDGPALEQASWEAAVSSAVGEAASDAWKMDRAEYLRRLKALYQQTTGNKPDLPKPPKPAEGEPKPDPVEFAIGQLEPGLRAGFAVGGEQVEELAQARAVAVRDALLGDEGLDGERVFISRGDEADAADGNVRMTLSLE